MDKLEFEYPVDFQDEVEVEVELLPEPPPFKASAILYVTSVSFLLGACMVTFMEMLSRPTEGDTFIGLLEWNPYSQIGAIGFVLGLFMFWLGLMVDRRGA